MPSPIENEIRRQLSRLLFSELSFSTFAEWFTANTWDLDETGDIPAIELKYEIELRLAEYSSGHWTAGELHRLLSDLLRSRTLARDTVSADMTVDRSHITPSPVASSYDLAFPAWVAV